MAKDKEVYIELTDELIDELMAEDRITAFFDFASNQVFGVFVGYYAKAVVRGGKVFVTAVVKGVPAGEAAALGSFVVGWELIFKPTQQVADFLIDMGFASVMDEDSEPYDARTDLFLYG